MNDSSVLPALRVWPRHLYSISFQGRKGYCAQGARAWFASYGLSWPDFVAQGVAATVLLETADPLALALVEHAQQLEESQDGR